MSRYAYLPIAAVLILVSCALLERQPDRVAVDLDRTAAPVHATLSASGSVHLYSLVRNLPVLDSTRFPSCPDDQSYRLTMSFSTGGESLLVATADTGGCRYVRFNGETRQSDQTFWDTVASEVGVPVGQLTRP
jgi:hypothetical protein